MTLLTESKRADQESAVSVGRTRRARPTATAVLTWLIAAIFVLTLLAVLGSVVITSFAKSWRGGWWPDGMTTQWFGQAWNASGVASSIGVTFEVAALVVVLALLTGVPAGYVLARKKVPGKSIILLVMLLPVILPQMTYAVQLASLMYRLRLGGTITAVTLVNLVPALPLVILITVPFVSQIPPEMEAAARTLGAGGLRIFVRVLGPLLLPCIAACAILTMVRVLGSFELTFFVSSVSSQTLVVSIFGALSDPGGVPAQLSAAMTVFYMIIAFIGLAASLRFANPVNALARSRQ